MRRLLFAVAVLLSGCGTIPVSQLPSAYVLVENRNWLDARVYAVCNSMEIRIGIANGLGKSILKIPYACVASGGTISFVDRPIGSHDVSYSDQISVNINEMLRLTVPTFFNGILEVYK
jgi:hypothetical protein